MGRIEESLNERREKGLLRVLRPARFRKEGKIYFEEKVYVDFSSNDYLGLSNHPLIKQAAKDALEKWGTSSSASRLLSGDLELHHELEAKVAAFKEKEDSLVFNSGYQANVGIISALCKRGDVVFSDKLNHASIVDGILLSGVEFFRFHHNDMNHLEFLLKRERKKKKEALIITETIFSMDGDRAPLKALVELKERYNCKVLADEAHATGIFGTRGSGIVEEERLAERIDLIMGTFSKALGSFGAYVACSFKLKNYLVNSSRSFIYSTALPASIIAANLTSIDLIEKEPFRRKLLLENSYYFRQELKRSSFDVRGSSQIVPVIVGDSKKAAILSQGLRDGGYWILPIRPPTVPEGESRLRFSLTYEHTKTVLEEFLCEINRI